MSRLLKNAKFKSFIDDFMQVQKESENLSLDECRQKSTDFFLSKCDPYEPVDEVHETSIKTEDGHTIALKIYISDKNKNLPLLLFFHRGGFVFGNLLDCEAICRKIANHLHCQVVAVDYRLAPENPFPSALEDAYDAVLWAAAEGKNKYVNTSKLYVCGESAGGNLAAAICLKARDLNGPKIDKQILFYPAITSTIDPFVYKDNEDQYFITKKVMELFWSLYLPNEEKFNPYASLEKNVDFSNLPPALIITAGFDALRHEALKYASSLQQAGTICEYKCIPDVIHGFLDLPCYEEEDKDQWLDSIYEML